MSDAIAAIKMKTASNYIKTKKAVNENISFQKQMSRGIISC